MQWSLSNNIKTDSFFFFTPPEIMWVSVIHAGSQLANL